MRETPKAVVWTGTILKYLFMIILVFIAVAPLIWAFLSSFKTYQEINSSAISLPSSFSLKNYIDAFKYAPIGQYFCNSVIIVGASIVITIILVSMCAYVTAHFNFRLKALVILLISASLMLPAQAISQPLFTMFQELNLFDTKTGLVIVYSAMGIPMSFFVMMSYYQTIPSSLIEAAYIDGAGFVTTFVRVILPLVKPCIVTIAMLQFINTWNEFYFALMLTSGNSARTVPIALNYYLGTFASNYSALFAAVVLTIAPTILIFIVLQKQVIESLTEGAVKG